MDLFVCFWSLLSLDVCRVCYVSLSLRTLTGFFVLAGGMSKYILDWMFGNNACICRVVRMDGLITR